MIAAAMVLALTIAVSSVALLACTERARSRDSAPSSEMESAPPASIPGTVAAPRVDGSHRHNDLQTFRPTSSRAELQVLPYQHFVVGYDNQAKEPAWVTYDLDGPITHPGRASKRPQKFATDERSPARVRHEDYNRSGFDRGHLCPSYSMFAYYGEAGEDETFVMTNVIPQVHSVNAGIWEELEERIARRSGTLAGWATTLRHITVINGPVYPSHPQRLPAGMEVPEACFSIIFDYLEDRGASRALAFEIPNHDGVVGPLDRYLVSIKHLEQETGLNVFAGVDPTVLVSCEAVVASTIWP